MVRESQLPMRQTTGTAGHADIRCPEPASKTTHIPNIPCMHIILPTSMGSRMEVEVGACPWGSVGYASARVPPLHWCPIVALGRAAAL